MNSDGVGGRGEWRGQNVTKNYEFDHIVNCLMFSFVISAPELMHMYDVYL